MVKLNVCIKEVVVVVIVVINKISSVNNAGNDTVFVYDSQVWKKMLSGVPQGTVFYSLLLSYITDTYKYLMV